MIVYGDLVAILNFCVDFLLLLGTNRLTGFPQSPGRCAVASILGAVYAVTCLLPGWMFLGGFLWRVVSLGLMGRIAFGGTWGKRTLVFLLLTFALGGAAALLRNRDFFAPVAAAGFLWMLCRVGLGGRIGSRRLVRVEITGGCETVTLTALHDTGNNLRDPITGQPVLVVDGPAAEALTGLTESQLRDPLGTLTAYPTRGLHLIPYSAVGRGNGMLLAKKYTVRIGNEEGRRMVAFAPEGLGGDYRALTGG